MKCENHKLLLKIGQNVWKLLRNSRNRKLTNERRRDCQMSIINEKLETKRRQKLGEMFLKCLSFCRSKHTSSSQRQYPTVREELCHRFSLADMRKSTNNFDQKRLIGQEASGKVYKGYLQHHDGSDYTAAVKRFNQDTRIWKEFINKIELLCQLHHPNW